MGNVFGRQGRVTSRVTDQDRAILQLKQQRDKLKQYQKKITLQLEKERCLAKQLLKDGKKERALLLLKKKRYQDQLLDKTDVQISNLERMVQDIEFAQIEIKVIEGLKAGNDCLKQMHEITAGSSLSCTESPEPFELNNRKHCPFWLVSVSNSNRMGVEVMSIEEVERILEETQEAIEYQKQIDELLAGSLTPEDEDAVLAELEAIIQGEDITLPELPTDPLPAVPKGETERKEAQIKPEREMLAA